MSVIEICGGLFIVLVILWDAFETTVLPRTVHRRFRLTRLIARSSWVPWSAFARLPFGSERQDSLLAMYGPSLLLLLLVVWALSLILGFGLMLYGFADHGSSLSLQSALYESGSTFFTLGLGDVVPANSVSRAISVAEAGTGFGFLALVIGYLPITYQAFARREVAISLLDARAGSPPTAVELLRRNGERVEEKVLAEWEAWAADLLESHLSYPVLAYFRSQHEKQSWLAALTVILDTSALLMTGIEGMSDQQARFTFAMARHALVDLTQIFFADPTLPAPERLPHEGFVELRSALEANGFVLKLDAEAEPKLAALRKAYEPIANALSQRLVIELPPWIPSPDAEDDWQSSPWDKLPPL